MISIDGYCVADPDSLETPAMLMFRDRMEHNIRQVCELAGGGENLMVHVKTHKSEAVARKQVELGIAGFKCATLKELDMVLSAGAKRAILAYPQIQRRKIERLCDLASAHAEAWIATVASSPVHVDALSAAAASRKQPLNVMLDLDAGMRRTGIGFGPDAAALYRRIDTDPYLQASGFHLYDGHDHFTDLRQREAAAGEHIRALQAFRHELESDGVAVPLVVGGNSFSFSYYARTDGMLGSPGTFIYWDTGYGAEMPDMPFHCAALVLTQVIDRYPEAGRITTDLGYKAVAGDIPLEERASLLGRDDATLVLQDEEHGVFRMPGELPDVGEYLLAVPGHACPTTIRYPGSHVLDSEGRVVDFNLHTARDRI